LQAGHTLPHLRDRIGFAVCVVHNEPDAF
jgi:hypothetical protein